jgi:hypothetical protein
MGFDEDYGMPGTTDRGKGMKKGYGDAEEDAGLATGDEEMEEGGLERQGMGQAQESPDELEQDDDLLDH